MFRRMLRAIFSGIGITLMVAVVLSVLLWVFGPFLAFGESRPFGELIGQLVGLAVLWIGALLVILLLLLTGRKRDERLTEEIVTAVDPGPGANEVVTAEVSEMRTKLREALKRLRRTKLGRRHLYELPWYIIIGPPGAGKTTAIVNSGLNFPLADEMGKTSIAGVGGTRNCDWWFTDNAVLVDTAGRYTTQESDAEADNAAWLGFLNLLKKHRKRQPINGAIIAISLSDLSNTDEFTQKAHAGAIRRRLHELREKLGVRFPVYVLFTKADLLAGFTETFEGLPKEEREQVWGFTLPLPGGRDTAAPSAAFDQEFDLLLQRVNAQVLERLDHESDPQRRALIASFPSQLASVRPVARDFLAEVFQENRFEHRQMLRGAYFTSGTQEGTPIDRLMMGMARTFGIGRQAISQGRGAGRSYFLTHLFDQVMFRESGLVSADDKVERRYRWMRVAAFVAAFVAAAGMGTLWVRSYLGNRALAATVNQQIADYRTAAAQIPGSPIGDSDVVSVVPALEILRNMPGNPFADAPFDDSGLGWGLNQVGVIGNEAHLTYRAALNQHLLPRLLLRLEDQIQGNINSPDLLFDTLKAYLMLGLAGPMETAHIRKVITEDWALAFPDPSRDGLRAMLERHLDALLAQPMQKVALNGDLIEQARGILTQMPQAQRVYNTIIASPAAQQLPKFRLTDVGGPAVTRVFVRSSGKPLNDGIEGVYTYKGYQEFFLGQALEVAEQLQRDAWVLSEQGAVEISETALLNISRDVLGLYFNDYVARYDALLGDIDILPLESLSHAVEVLNVLTGPTSPIVNVLTAVSNETKLTAPPPPPPGAETVGAVGQVAGDLFVMRLSIRSRMLFDALSRTSGPQGQPPEVPGTFVDRRFQALHDLVARKEGQPSQLDGLMGMLGEVHQTLSQLNFSGGVGNPQADSTALLRFQEAANRLPGPIQRWSSQLAVGSSGITSDGTRAGINAKWQGTVLGFCEQATANSYPFNRRARADIGIRDFATLFAPGGQIDTFFKENLEKFVDTRSKPWTSKVVNGTDLGLSQAVLEQFQHAAEIRDAFFGGGPEPSVKFQVTPEALDPTARGIVLEIDGQPVSYAHGARLDPVAITWPGAVGLARVTFDAPAGQSENVLSRDGPWGWFRLLDAAENRRTNVSDRTRTIFRVGGKIAIFQVQAGSVLNPFGLPALSKFSCPKSF